MGTYQLDLDNKNVKFVFQCLVVFANIVILFVIYLSSLFISTYYYKYKFQTLSQEVKTNSLDSLLLSSNYKKLFFEKEGVIRKLSVIESLLSQANVELALKNIEELPPPLKPLFFKLKLAIEENREKVANKDAEVEAQLKQLLTLILLDYVRPEIKPENENAYRRFCDLFKANCP
ncbi:MAG: hypothetical protein KBC84_04870 [Proteobacteria bacterium]|nr:hypothetical protein [Pseudomonadota bacterium]